MSIQKSGMVPEVTLFPNLTINIVTKGPGAFQIILVKVQRERHVQRQAITVDQIHSLQPECQLASQRGLVGQNFEVDFPQK